MIIAVDFDGILAGNGDEFPDVGDPNAPMVELIKELLKARHEVVLWTSRTGSALSRALTWSYFHGIEFSAINDNAPSNKDKYLVLYPTGTRKVYADIYIDDKNPEFIIDVKKHGHDTAIRNTVNRVKEILKLWKEEN